MIDKSIDRLYSMLRPMPPLNQDDQADVNRLGKVQDHLARSIELANLREDPLRFPLQAISDALGLQVSTHIATRQLLHRAIGAADQVNHPSDALRRQVNASFNKLAREQWLRFAAMVGVLFAFIVTIVSTILAWGIIEAHRNSPDAEAFLVAAGNFPAEWTLLVRQNNLPWMVAACARPESIIVATNGRRYCSIPLAMDGVEAKVPPPPAWAQDPATGPK